jgi:hypothetical protein
MAGVGLAEQLQIDEYEVCETIENRLRKTSVVTIDDVEAEEGGE